MMFALGFIAGAAFLQVLNLWQLRNFEDLSVYADLVKRICVRASYGSWARVWRDDPVQVAIKPSEVVLLDELRALLNRRLEGKP